MWEGPPPAGGVFGWRLGKPWCPGGLRDLLRLVAAELERLAAEETDPQRRTVLLKRAMRIRARLHETWPPFSADPGAQA